MNIFFVDQDPVKAAQALVDQHANKQVVESCQMLANCYSLEELASNDCPKTKKGNDRKYSYFNHPCSIWTRKTINNFNWLLNHSIALEEERMYRGFNPHFSISFIEWCVNNPPDLTNAELTPPAQAFGEWDYLRGDDPVEAYRRYYNIAKRQQETLKKVWTRRRAPDWWIL